MHEMKCLRENEDQLRSQSMLPKVQRGECNDFWKAIKVLNLKKESLPLTVGGTSGERSIANLWEDYFSEIAYYVGFTDNRDQVMNALRNVPGNNDEINVHELRQIVRTHCKSRLSEDWKIVRLLAMMEFHHKSIRLHPSDCWSWSKYSFPVEY